MIAMADSALGHIGIALLGLLIAAFSSTLSAAEASDGQPPVTLVVKPSICVAKRGETVCVSTMDISWQSGHISDYCLYSGRSVEPLQCWQGAAAGEFRDKVILDGDLEYWITESGQVRQLARAAVKLAALKPHRKQPRRRNRLPWSIVGT